MSTYYVSSGVTSTGLNLNSDYMYVYSGGVASSTSINEGGWMEVSSGGRAISTTLNSGLWIAVRVGATATDTKIFSAGAFFSGTMSRTSIRNGGSAFVKDGGKAFDNIVLSGGELFVDPGGTATRRTTCWSGSIRPACSATTAAATRRSGSRWAAAST